MNAFYPPVIFWPTSVRNVREQAGPLQKALARFPRTAAAALRELGRPPNGIECRA